MSTITNLQEAFAGESQANQKYRAFAKRAEQAGFQLSRLVFSAFHFQRFDSDNRSQITDYRPPPSVLRPPISAFYFQRFCFSPVVP